MNNEEWTNDFIDQFHKRCEQYEQSFGILSEQDKKIALRFYCEGYLNSCLINIENNLNNPLLLYTPQGLMKLMENLV